MAHERFRGVRSRGLVSAAMFAVAPLGSAMAQTPPDSAILRARTAFDFLVGTWQVVSRTDARGSSPASGETYAFTKGLDGVMIVGNWRFNRGTVDRPDVVNAVYYSGYDNTSRTWSFYYISPQSAQYWPGTEVNGRWYFNRPFTLGDTTFLQRQWWERVDANTLDRHVHNSPDGGRTWRPFTVRLRRIE